MKPLKNNLGRKSNREQLGMSTKEYVEAVRNAAEKEDWATLIKLKRTQVRWLYNNSNKCLYVIPEDDVWLMVQKAYLAGLENRELKLLEK